MCFVHQIKRTNGAYNKGIEVKETLDAAKQSYHAYLGAYAYRKDAQTDLVSAMITDETGMVLFAETWNNPAEETNVEEGNE